MRIAMVGLGRMGADLVRRLMRNGITASRSIGPDPVNFDLLGRAVSEGLPAGQRYCFNLRDIAEAWRRSRVIGSWLSISRQLHYRGARIEELFRVCRG